MSDDRELTFYGHSNRMLIEMALKSGELRDCQIVECELNGMKTGDAVWDHADMRDLHANDTCFQGTGLRGSRFFRSSFMRARFLGCRCDRMVFDGLTLIKSQWSNNELRESTIQNASLQRAVFRGNRFISSSFSDFEALDAVVEDCVFAHSSVNISYGSGMNGFSGGLIKNCIFYNCRFEGFPLRGADVESCVFLYCRGEIGDEMVCRNVAGLGLRGQVKPAAVKDPAAAERLLKAYR